MVPGINVSHWQNDINWADVKRSGVKFAFIKATEFQDKRTSLVIDNKFRHNAESAAMNGIQWGACHFFRTHIDPITQAKAFCDSVGDFSSLPPVMELDAHGLRGERLNYKVRQFLDEIESISGRKPIISTGESVWKGLMMYEKREHTNWAREYHLWLSHLTALWPTVPYPWISWSFWRYSDKGTLPGIKTSVDLNWFNGSEETLIDRFINKQEPDYHSMQNINTDLPKGSLIEPTRNLDPYFQGKYQKDAQASYYGNPLPQIEKKPQAKYSSQQENWIRSYFFNNQG